MSANEEQVGGMHYKQQKIQPWDFIAANKLGYFEGNVVKYVARWRLKGGLGDLQKARHYLDKLIELESAVQRESQQLLAGQLQEILERDAWRREA